MLRGAIRPPRQGRQAQRQRRLLPPGSGAAQAGMPGRGAAPIAVAVAAAVVAVAAAAAVAGAGAGPGGAGAAWAQTTDTQPTLGVRLADTPPYHYKDTDGRTVVVGQVVNTNTFAASGVKVWVGFYGATGDEPLETIVGSTLTEVVPAGGTAPFAVRSGDASAAIADARVRILGFNYAEDKPQALRVEAGEQARAAGRLAVGGTVYNDAPPESPAADPVTVHMMQYDAFDPPRLLRHSSAPLGGPLAAGESARFSFDEPLAARADGVYLFAESGGAASNTADAPLSAPDLLLRRVSIDGVYLSDADGNRVQGGRAGSPLVITGSISLELQPSAQFEAQDYTFYAQVKRSGERPYIEFVGAGNGAFGSPASQLPSVAWTPAEPGLYFVETFVWDRGGAPLASRGPVVLVLVSQGG